jgi:dihydrofolate reductase
MFLWSLALFWRNKKVKISVIAAMAENGVIGNDNSIPWHIPEDFKYFKQITLGCPVIMGRKTWDSLPKKPLPKRENIIITRRKDLVAIGAHVCHDIYDAFALARRIGTEEIFVIGGEQIYNLALDTELIDKIYLTYIYRSFEGNAHFPIFKLNGWRLSKGKVFGNDMKYSFDVYERCYK